LNNVFRKEKFEEVNIREIEGERGKREGETVEGYYVKGDSDTEESG